MRTLLGFILGVLLFGGAWAADDIVVIAHPGITRVDQPMLQRLYTGRAVELGGATAHVVNAPPGSASRGRFLAQVVQLDDGRYTAYWTVRRHVGKGVPPRELGSSAEIIAYVQATPGAIGYIPASDLKPGLNVVLRP
jgi:ABC-type phosphate transport system substrate-binding protein